MHCVICSELLQSWLLGGHRTRLLPISTTLPITHVALERVCFSSATYVQGRVVGVSSSCVQQLSLNHDWSCWLRGQQHYSIHCCNTLATTACDAQVHY